VTPGASVQKALPASAASKQEIYASQISAIKELSWIGPLFRSSDDVIELTESETEYVVRCIKHTFLNHMVFQFDITNTLNDQLLENVRVEMEETEGFSVLSNVPIPHLPFNQPKTTYTLVQLDDSGIGE
jgi:coatomer protein complex subunit gamma